MSQPHPSPSYFWSQSHESAVPLFIAAYQSPSIIGGLDASISHMDSIASQAHLQGAHLLIFPELFLRGYDLPSRAMKKAAIHRNGQEMQRLQDMARSHQLALCFGYAERAEQGNDVESPEAVYNSVICIDSDGSIAGHYRKTHLWGSEEKRRYIPGSPDELHQQPLFPLRCSPIHQFALLICYDIEFPETARLLALRGATVLLVVTALADSGSIDLVPTLIVPTRALENHCWVCYVNLAGRRQVDKIDPEDNEEAILTFRGQSAIVGPDGVDLARAPPSVSTGLLLMAEVKPTPRDVLTFQSSPYLLDRRPECYDGLNAGHREKGTVKRP